ncbi:hypothetical protein IVB69_01320 [Flavobacterium sp. J49]|uniref:hypothetical protein n=1 Tax=Flavobacterium sp. J49 TaxID=2718534 RepID=UPI001592B10E|nr:hypothetical protein [Flavobacterium sp. J49]MBF6640109.1 hypothetical protein [Flavobacterium sp. J49]NIC01354.1 hypothetical protein [Flavobacterium sp. J49]
MKTTNYLILLCLFFFSCSSNKNGETYNIENSEWIYSDFEISYNLFFKPSGKLESTHPNDNTLDNDFWKQKGKTIRFSFNNKYSTYKFRFSGKDTIVGKGKNKKFQWDFKLVRVRKTTANNSL